MERTQAKLQAVLIEVVGTNYNEYIDQPFSDLILSFSSDHLILSPTRQIQRT